MKKILFLILAILFTNQAFAAEKVINWKIDNSKSKIEFVATQRSNPIKGSFGKFSGTINFSQNNLKDSNIAILINLNSVKVSLTEASSVLKEPNWFDAIKFPNAEFKSKTFTKIADNQFRCDGVLTLKGVQSPAVLDFTFDKYSPKAAIVNGEAKINRLDFKVGKKDESGIQDVVVVKFTIVASN